MKKIEFISHFTPLMKKLSWKFKVDIFDHEDVFQDLCCKILELIEDDKLELPRMNLALGNRARNIMRDQSKRVNHQFLENEDHETIEFETYNSWLNREQPEYSDMKYLSEIDEILFKEVFIEKKKFKENSLGLRTPTVKKILKELLLENRRVRFGTTRKK